LAVALLFSLPLIPLLHHTVTNVTNIESPPPVSLWAKMIAAVAWAPTLAWNLLLGRMLHVRDWWDWVDPQVLIGGYPFARDVARLQALGICGVVNMCAEYRGPCSAYARAGIEQLWLPTVDFTPPTLPDVDRGVAFIERFVSRGQKVYVHCKAGRARSATVVICWLYRDRRMSLQEAQQALLAARPHVNPHLTDRAVVRQFALANPRMALTSDG